jgi:hypothetical protein
VVQARRLVLLIARLDGRQPEFWKLKFGLQLLESYHSSSKDDQLDEV